MRHDTNWLADHIAQSNRGHFSEAEAAEAVFLFMRGIDECWAAFYLGRAHFRAEAVRIVEDALPEILIEQLLEAVLQVCLARMMGLPPGQPVPPETTEPA